MKKLIPLLVLCTSLFAQAQDALLQKNLNVVSDQYDQVLLKTEANVKIFVDNFNVQLASGSKITSPKTVTGTILNPVLKISVKKCVLFVCNTIDLDSEFSLVKNPPSTNCDNSYTLLGDLRRSSQLLTDNYTDLNTAICLKKNATGALATLTVTLVRSKDYNSGVVQSEILKFVKLQSNAVIESFSKVLVLNGAKQVSSQLK